MAAGCDDEQHSVAASERDSRPGDLHVHDLRYTVGMRLREMEVLERTISDVLWHQSGTVTHLYTQAQVEEIRNALERIAKESSGHKNRALTGLSKAAQRGRVPSESLQRVQQRKTG
jgi:integrase